MMRISFIFGVFLIPCLVGIAKGQGFDPNCYYPKIGIEIDTLLRTPTNGYFFANDLIKNPNAPDSEEQIVITGYPTNPPFMTTLSSGATLDIHKLQVRKKWTVDLSGAIFGNFHTTKYKDAFMPQEYRIYWADEKGDFDSSLFTDLWSSVQGNRSPETGGGFKYENMNPYVAKVINDSLEDIVTVGYTNWNTLNEMRDSSHVYVLLFHGVEIYKHGKVALSDSAYEVPGVSIWSSDSNRLDRNGNRGDFRGTGRLDWITSDGRANYFYFKNDLSFSMQKFASSLIYDTLITKWENPHLVEDERFYNLSRTALRAFPKLVWDKSYDFVGRFNTDDERKEAWFFFRGGPNFGSKRLYLDSVEQLIRKPTSFGSDYDVGFNLDNCGDMTGTENTVMVTGVGVGHDGGNWLYYVLGKATDENVDIDIPVSVVDGTGGGASPIPVKANDDSLQDVVFGVTNYKGSSLDPVSSSLALFLGSDKIPVTLNPKYGVRPNKISNETQELICYPNPASIGTTISFYVQKAGRHILEIRDILGRMIQKYSLECDRGVEDYYIPLRNIPDGTYYLILQGNNGTQSRGKVIIQR